MLEKNIENHSISNKSEHVRGNIGSKGSTSADVSPKFEGVQEEGNSSGKGGGNQQGIDGLLVISCCFVLESQVVEEEPNIVLGPNIKDLGCPGQIEEKNLVLLCFVLQVGQRVPHSSLGAEESKHIRKEDKQVFHNIILLEVREEIVVVIQPLKGKEKGKEEVLFDECITDSSFVSKISWILGILWKESEGVDGSERLTDPSERKSNDEWGSQEHLVVVEVQTECCSVLDQEEQSHHSMFCKFSLEDQVDKG